MVPIYTPTLHKLYVKGDENFMSFKYDIIDESETLGKAIAAACCLHCCKYKFCLCCSYFIMNVELLFFHNILKLQYINF